MMRQHCNGQFILRIEDTDKVHEADTVINYFGSYLLNHLTIKVTSVKRLCRGASGQSQVVRNSGRWSFHIGLELRFLIVFILNLMRISTGLVHYLALIGSSKGVFHVSHLLVVFNKFRSRHYSRFSCLPRLLSSVSSFVRSIISSAPALPGHFDTDLVHGDCIFYGGALDSNYSLTVTAVSISPSHFDRRCWLTFEHARVVSRNMVTLHVKTTAGKKFLVDVVLKSTLLQCKEALVASTDVPTSLQRLIHKGKVIKDDQTLQNYGIQA
ncbi:hypothetical protein PsorP6_003637 [Peronosclerospora sorghi]|uniref:Uncharacterized protein n=1 Tax=Peronosclerospora sorghi TaxID=230839 RepID=A0ACC0VQT9_9STRA|nr:hypothetical protein PsorP6_003637 [Peronosclerospora sorghi]